MGLYYTSNRPGIGLSIDSRTLNQSPWLPWYCFYFLIQIIDFVNKINIDRQLDDVILNSKRNIYFDEVKDNWYKPRSIFIDVDPWTWNDLLNCEISALLTEDSIVSGYSGSNHSYAEGYALYGYELKDLIQDRVRTAFEKCDSIGIVNFFN